MRETLLTLNLQFFGGRGSAGGNAKAAAERSVAAAANQSATIASVNSEGQELSIPRKTIEDRLKRAEEQQENLRKMRGTNPEDHRRAKEQVEELRETLKTGKTAAARNQTVQMTNRSMNSPVKSATATAEKQIKAIDKKLSNGSSMTKMGSGKAGSYVVDLSNKDSSNKQLTNALKKAGFRQVGNSRWIKNGV